MVEINVFLFLFCRVQRDVTYPRDFRIVGIAMQQFAYEIHVTFFRGDV